MDSKETQELGIALKNLMLAIGKAYEDSKFDLATELPTVIMGLISDLPAAIKDIDKMGEEFKARPVLATNALISELLVGVDGLLEGIKKGKAV